MHDRLCRAVRMGVPYEIAARAAGIGKKTFLTWRKKGEEAARDLPDNWHNLPLAKLQVIAEDLEIDEADVLDENLKTGRADGKLCRQDWIRAINRYDGRFRSLVVALDEAEAQGAALNFSLVMESAKGGRKIVKTKTKITRDSRGRVVAKTEEVVEIETPPNARDAKWILAARHGIRDRGTNAGVQQKSPEELAKAIREAIRAGKDTMGME